MEKSKISVIIPFYNASKYIDRCVDSVMQQDYTPIEIVIVNDGSSEKESDSLKKYINFENIIVINKENGGVGSARNKGKNIATGEWITFLDADDWIETDFCSELIQYADKGDIICANYIREFSDGKQDMQSKVEKVKKMTLEENIDDFFSISTKKYNTVHTMPWGKIIKTSVVKNIDFDENLFLGEDLLFNASILNKNPQIIFVNKYLYHYSKYTNGLTNSIDNINKNFFSNDLYIYERLRNLKIVDDETLDTYYLHFFLYRDVYNLCIIENFNTDNIGKQINNIINNTELAKIITSTKSDFLMLCIKRHLWSFIKNYFWARYSLRKLRKA